MQRKSKFEYLPCVFKGEGLKCQPLGKYRAVKGRVPRGVVTYNARGVSRIALNIVNKFFTWANL